ncbi:hypothetical protein PIB30_078310 [Stylosanthes scabra]|uniref:CCHC-type domain-containing protein n=1 Tax=Stylosanthes scabra TaxID=79078 RepID=A0ABU6SQX2_9FABA|nr:hypothetical protein [Stylosanthes scabra]
MAANRRNARRVSVDFDPPTDTATFMAAMNSMATAMHDSTAAIRESAAVTNRAMEYMGRRIGNNGNGGDNDEMDNGVGGNNRPMTLATFLKGDAHYWWQGVCQLRAPGEAEFTWDEFRTEFYKKYFPPSARMAKELELREDLLAFVGLMEIRTFAELVNKSQLVKGCSKKLEAAQENRREVVHKNFNKSLAPRGINFKANGQQHRRNQQGGNLCNYFNDHNYNLGQKQGEQSEQDQDDLICPKCGKNHGRRRCQFGMNTCYYCSKEGHLARDCRKRIADRASRS